MKPITEKDLGLTPEEIKELVTGAQKYLPPTDDEGNPIAETTKEPDHARH